MLSFRILANKSHHLNMIWHIRCIICQQCCWWMSASQGSGGGGEAVACSPVVALFGSHLQLTNATIPVAISTEIHHRLLWPHWLSETHTLPSRLQHKSCATCQDLLFYNLIPYLLNRLLCHLPFTPGASRWKRHRHVLIGEIKALLLF